MQRIEFMRGNKIADCVERQAKEIERLVRELSEEQIKRAETVAIIGRLRAALEGLLRHKPDVIRGKRACAAWQTAEQALGPAQEVKP